jgi:Leu/Phe-tRNA-protein transferase
MSSFITGSFPMNMNILPLKIWAPRDQMVIFSKAALMILTTFHRFVKTISLNETAKMVSLGN